jgi:hypothetical protein
MGGISVMKKHIYRATNVNKVNWDKIAEVTEDKKLVFAIDVAKKEQFAMLMDKDNEVYGCIKWSHPQETPLLLEQLGKLSFAQLDVAMEPTGVYGDTLRRQFKLSGYKIFQIAGKRVNDVAEVYDGVPSLHDAKSAYLIARLYWEDVGHEWVEATDQQRECRAYCQLYDNYDEQIRRIDGRLEGKIQTHWPELPLHLDVHSVTAVQLLIEYGSPAKLTEDIINAEELMQTVSRGKLKQQKIEGLIEASQTSIGIPCLNIECWQIQQLATELKRLKLKQDDIKKKLAMIIDDDPELTFMGKLIGKVTTAMLLSCNLDPRHYHSTAAYIKAAGLNLKEKSSGKHKGQLKITKRGPGRARKYLYFAVLRLIQHNPVMKCWYENKLRQHGNEGKQRWITALMRKLTMGLWHVGRGNEFDGTKLFDIKIKA